MKIKEIIVEGWGAETQKAQHDKNMVAVAKVLQKYQDDPELSAIASYMFQNNWAADAIDKTLQGQGKYDVDWWKATMAKKPQFQNHTQMMIDKYLTPNEDIVDEDSIRPNLVTFLKQAGFNGPFKLKQFPDLLKDFENEADENSQIMIQGDDPEYDAWVIKGFMSGYAVGQEQGYQDRLSAQQVVKLVKDKQDLAQEDLVGEEPASRALCTSGKSDSALGASQLASCKSQGYRSRDGGKSHKVGSERVKVRGKRIKGKKYGGPLPDWS